MKIDDINLCMNVLSAFESDAKDFVVFALRDNKVTKSGPWGEVSWWNEMVTKYLKTGAIACGGAALASAAEFAGSKNDIPAEVYIRLWTITAPSVHRFEAYGSLGSFGGPYIPAIRQYLKKGPTFMIDSCDDGTMNLKNALTLIECLPPEDPAQNRLTDFVAETDMKLLPLAFFLRNNGGVFNELSKIC